MRYAMIMAGGRGTRLWPMSREAQPKQLIPFIDRGDGVGRCLLQLSAERLDGVVPPERRYICTGERYRGEVRDACPEFDDAHILGEPEPRDTVNAVGLAAAVFAAQDPDAVFSVLTADHVIEPQSVFAERVTLGYELVEADPRRLVTFGIEPTHAATGYGYIEQGEDVTTDGRAFDVERFVEKPDAARAQAYLDSGGFLWNAGMFVFHAECFLKLLDRFMPENAAGLREIGAAWGTDHRREVLGRVFPTLPKNSVDYGVMEPAAGDGDAKITGIRMPVDWLDVGSWPTYAQTLPPDAAGNRRSGACATVFHDAKNNLVVGDERGKTIALLGCEDLIVVETERATLIMPRKRAEDLKSLHAGLPDELR